MKTSCNMWVVSHHDKGESSICQLAFMVVLSSIFTKWVILQCRTAPWWRGQCSERDPNIFHWIFSNWPKRQPFCEESHEKVTKVTSLTFKRCSSLSPEAGKPRKSCTTRITRFPRFMLAPGPPGTVAQHSAFHNCVGDFLNCSNGKWQPLDF